MFGPPAGSLNKKITILSRTEKENEAGETVPTYEPTLTVYGSFEAVKSEKRVHFAESRQYITHKVVMRWRELPPQCRLKIGRKVVEIATEIPNADEGVLTLFVTEAETAGK